MGLFTPYHTYPKIQTCPFHYLLISLKSAGLRGNQCRPWSETESAASDMNLHCLLRPVCRGHPRAFREGEVLQQFQSFREKFWSKFWIYLYILYIFTSPSAQDRKVSQLRETYSPKSPSRMTPACLSQCFGLELVNSIFQLTENHMPV